MLLDYLSQISDTRRQQGQLYQLPYMLLFSIFAILCGATSYRKIQRFINAHRERLNEVFGLRWKRAPVHTSIRYILQSLKTDNLESVFRDYSRALSSDEEPETERWYVAIDGKQLRGSFDHFEDHKAVHLLSAFSFDEQLILGHRETDEKSNEIPAVQRLIEELGLNDCVFTLDAMHCQKKTVDLIKRSGNDLIVQVKGNQKHLLEAVKGAETLSGAVSTDEQYEHTRNRMTTRDVTVFEAPPVLAKVPDWKELIACVIRVERTTDSFDTRTHQWKRSYEMAYYLSTDWNDAKEFAKAIRGHWGTPNREHYVRDVTLKEDASRIRKNPGIFARLRSFALNILRKNKINNVSEALFDNALNLNLVFEYQGVF